MTTPLRLLVLILVALGLAGPLQAHEGHDHGAPPAPAGANVAPRTEASSDDFELVAIARGTDLEITLDTFPGNELVVDAAIEIDSPTGVLKPRHRGNGVYVVAAPFLRTSGRYDLAFTVAAAAKIDLLTATLVVPRTSAEAKPASGGAPVIGGLTSYQVRAIAGGLVAAFVAGVVIARGLRPRTFTAGLALALGAVANVPGARAETAEAALITTPAAAVVRDVAQRLADGAVFVPKTTQRILAIRTVLSAEESHARSVELPGRIIPNPNASGLVQASIGGRLSPPTGGFKSLGTPVKAGDVLAYVRPPLPSADATVQAQQARELDQQISIVARKVERLSAIQQVIAKSQLEDAQLELKGLKERRANLDRVNREPEPLLAPVDGVIASANAIAGQMAEPSSVIFQIVDPVMLWIEALAFEPQSLTTSASARAADGRLLGLSYLGSGLADRNQAIPVQFAIKGEATGLRPGQLVTVFATTTDVRKGIALPRAAVLRSANGQAIVYEHTSAERFVPREVRTLGLDGERVLVVSGLETARRVVTQGAELLDQIR